MNELHTHPRRHDARDVRHGAPSAPAIAPLVRRALLASARWLPLATAELTPADRTGLRDLDRWFAGFAAEVRAHHETVETWLLPTLTVRRALDHDARELIAVDHACVDHVLGELGDALGALAFGFDDQAEALSFAATLAMRLERLLDTQLTRESQLLVPLVATTLRPIERAAVDGEVLCGIAVRRAPFSLNWLCGYLTEGERDLVLARIPFYSAIAN